MVTRPSLPLFQSLPTVNLLQLVLLALRATAAARALRLPVCGLDRRQRTSATVTCIRECKPLQKMGCATKVSRALFWANCLCLDVAYCSQHFGRSRSRSSSRRSSVVAAAVVVVVIPAAAAVALLDTVFARWAAGVKGGVGWAGLEIMTNTIASNNYFAAILACA